MLSAEITVSVKIEIETNVSVAEKRFIGEMSYWKNSGKRKVTIFYKQIRYFSTNIALNIKGTEIARQQTGTF